MKMDPHTKSFINEELYWDCWVAGRKNMNSEYCNDKTNVKVFKSKTTGNTITINCSACLKHVYDQKENFVQVDWTRNIHELLYVWGYRWNAIIYKNVYFF